MIEGKLTMPEPVPQPEPTVTLTMSMREAKLLHLLCAWDVTVPNAMRAGGTPSDTVLEIKDVMNGVRRAVNPLLWRKG